MTRLERLAGAYHVPGGPLDQDEVLALLASLRAGVPSTRSVRAVVRAAEQAASRPRRCPDVDAPSGAACAARSTGARSSPAGVLPARQPASTGRSWTPYGAARTKWRAEAATASTSPSTGTFVGLVAVADPVRDSAEPALAALRAAAGRRRHAHRRRRGDGPRGRRPARASPTSRRGSCRRARARSSPRCASRAGSVAMAADGVNDAPALTAPTWAWPWGAAPTSPSRAPGSPCSTATPEGLVRARALSRATMRTSASNLVFAFVYNAAGVPLAAASPTRPSAGCCRRWSRRPRCRCPSDSVIGNALRLRTPASLTCRPTTGPR